MSCSLISKRLPFIAQKNLFLQNKGNCMRHIIVRNGHGKIYYRSAAPLEQPKEKINVFIGALTWWWVFWNLFTEPHLLTGHDYPKPSKWTDEELGIPED